MDGDDHFDFDKLCSRSIQEAYERLDDFFLGESFDTDPDVKLANQLTPKKKSVIEKLISHIEEGYSHLYILSEIIKKLGPNKFRLYSQKKDQEGKRRNLGTFSSLKKARQREKQVQFFKQKD